MLTRSNDKVVPMHAMKANGDMTVWLHSFLTLALVGAKGLASRDRCFPPPPSLEKAPVPTP